MASSWVEVGYTYYNDPPPGAGNLAYGGYAFAELGTATRQGQATGKGNLSSAMGLGFEEPMGSEWSLYAGHNVVIARKEDRGYGQGGDGINSDPRYAIDLYDGSKYGLHNLVAALGAAPSGALWIMRGRWRVPMALPAGAARLQAVGGLVAFTPSPSNVARYSTAKHDYSRKVRDTGNQAGKHGSTIQRVNKRLDTIPGRYRH